MSERQRANHLSRLDLDSSIFPSDIFIDLRPTCGYDLPTIHIRALAHGPGHG